MAGHSHVLIVAECGSFDCIPFSSGCMSTVYKSLPIHDITMSQWAVFPLSRGGSAKTGLTILSTYTVTCNLEHGTSHDIQDPHSQDISILQLLDGSMLRSPGLFYAPCLRRIQAFPAFKGTWEGGAFKVQKAWSTDHNGLDVMIQSLKL